MTASGKYTPANLDGAIVTHADLIVGDRVGKVLEAHQEAANGRLRGIKYTAKCDPDPVIRGTIGPGRPGVYLEKSFGEGLDRVTALGLAFDASIDHSQTPTWWHLPALSGRQHRRDPFD